MEEAAHLPEIGPELEEQLRGFIEKWNAEVRALLPSLPDGLEVVFDNSYLNPEEGTGGFTLSKREIALAFDPSFKVDRDDQIASLRGTYFHEAFHVVQGFTGENYDVTMPAIENAIYEGASTVFERDAARSDPRWGKYLDRDTMLAWTAEVKALPQEYDWQRYKFFDPETNRQWIMYRVGTFIVDEALGKNPELKIEDLSSKTPLEILELAEL